MERNAVKMSIMVRSTMLICFCFLLTSTGWLSWEYHLLDQVPARTSDICTMIVGYLLQAAGIGFFALFLRRKPSAVKEGFLTALILHMVFMVPAVLSPFTAGTLIFGFLMNLSCGFIAGYYLFILSKETEKEKKATVFGIGYGLAILIQWLLSLVFRSLYYSGYVLVICLALTAAMFFAVGKRHTEDNRDLRSEDRAKPKWCHLMPVSILVLLFSIVNSSGFAFPSADLGNAVNVELFRLIYAAGLIIAGIATDRNRKYGAMCALIALLLPFIILALRGEITASVIFWALSYFAFGFYAVYRIVVFSDLAADTRVLWLSGFGLMLGRIGDAAGEGICLVLGQHVPLLIGLTAVLFAVTVLVFFRVYQTLYIPEYRQQQDKKERLYAFSVQHDLSAREREMLLLLVDGKTNKEIADSLCISENTVKFHIRNLLQKTGCKNRNELVLLYMGENVT